MGQRLDGNGEGSGETEVADLEVSALGDQDILGLQISMKNPVGVDIVNSIQKLSHHFLDLVLGGLLSKLLECAKIFLEVVINILEDEVESLDVHVELQINHTRTGEDLSWLKGLLHDVWVLQLLQNHRFSVYSFLLDFAKVIPVNHLNKINFKDFIK